MCDYYMMGVLGSVHVGVGMCIIATKLTKQHTQTRSGGEPVGREKQRVQMTGGSILTTSVHRAQEL